MHKKIDDTAGYYLGLVLFTFAIPIIGAIGYWMAYENTQLPSDQRTSLVLVAPAAPAVPTSAAEPEVPPEPAPEPAAAH